MTPVVACRHSPERAASARRLGLALAAGLLIGAATGLAVGLTDPAWAALSMFLGAVAGAAAAAGAGMLAAVADRLFRTARAETRRVAVAAASGLGAASVLSVLAQVWHIVPPWSTLGPLVILALVLALTFRRLR
jgi:hypothetical protein